MGLPKVQRVDPIVQRSWDGGMVMVESLAPEQIPSDSAAHILNFEIDKIGNLKTRVATQAFFTTSEDDPLTSLVLARFSDGNSLFAYTQGSKLFTRIGSTNTDVTGAFVFPNGNRWYWVMFDDWLIGIHGSASTRPIKIDSSGNVTTLNANAPFAGHGVVWNNRLWLSGVTSNRNTIYASAINDPEDWTTTGDAGAITLGVDIGDGDKIHALSVFRGNLMVYKRAKINVVYAISAPATIPSNIRVDLYTSKLGCMYPATIQDALDDQLYLSESGVASLALSSQGDIEGAILSTNISDIGSIPVGSETIASSPCSIVIKGRQQYWLALPNSLSNSFGDTVWVLDYSDIKKRDAEGLPKVKWVRFDDDAFGTAYCEQDSTYTIYLVAQQFVNSVNTPVRFYSPSDPSMSFAGTYTRRLLTRGYFSESPMIRTLWHRFGLSFIKLSTTVAFTINYYYDNYLSAVAGSYSHSSDNSIPNTHRTYWRSFKKNDSGRKANIVQLEITANTTGQGFVVKAAHLEQTALNHKRAKTGWVSD